MARNIVVTLDGEESSFDFKAIDRAAIYGKRRRVALDRDGEACTRASLTEDGSVLIKSGMTGQAYFDEAGQTYKLAELVAYDADGKALTKVGSTLGVSQQLTGPVDPSELLDTRVGTVYLLSSEVLAPGLESQLKAGDVFSFPFNYRDDYSAERAFLLANDNGMFALVGVPVEHEWASLEVLAELPAADDESDDDLDFEMF
jgi:hypothetical protein